MAMSNQSCVNRILDEILRSGLSTYILAQYKARYGGDCVAKMASVLYSRRRMNHLPNESAALKKLDTQSWLNLMIHSWDEIFIDLLGQSERTYLHELRNARNRKSHPNDENQFTDEDVRRLAETATLLLEAIGAEKEAAATRKIEADYGHRIYGRSRQNGRKSKNGSDPLVRTAVGHPGHSSRSDSAMQQLLHQQKTLMSLVQQLQSQQQQSKSSATSDYLVQQLIRENQSLAQQIQNLEERTTRWEKPKRRENDPVVRQLLRQQRNLMDQVQRMKQSQHIVIENKPKISQVTQFAAPEKPKRREIKHRAMPLAAGFIAGVIGVFGIIGGVPLPIGIFGVAHLLNDKKVQGAAALIIGTVGYAVVCLLFFAAISDTALLMPLYILWFPFYFYAVWRHAKDGASYIVE